MPRNLSRQELKDLWVFSDDGKIYWKNDRPPSVVAGMPAGCINCAGYQVVSLLGSQYKVHRLVYAYHTGDWPIIVDHINGNRSDNRIENLRAVPPYVNSANTNKVSGKSSYRGVSLLNGRPRAFIQCQGRREFLGYFKTEQEAGLAYLKRRAELHKDMIGN